MAQSEVPAGLKLSAILLLVIAVLGMLVIAYCFAQTGDVQSTGWRLPIQVAV